MIRSPFRAGVLLGRGRPLVASCAALILSTVLLAQASAASAATLSEDMVQASKDACVNLARRRGFTVEQVINAQPASGDSASVVLKLMKAGEPYEFTCVSGRVGGEHRHKVSMNTWRNPLVMA